MGITSLLRVDLQIAGAWTNVTDHVFTQEKITIRRGRTSETSDPTPSAATLTFDNRDARFTPRNPAGAYYPNFGRNTPIRIGVGVPPQGSGALQAAAATISAPATIAESAGVALAIWAQTGAGTITAAAGYTSIGASSGTNMTMRVGRKAIGGAGAVAAAVASSTVTALGAGAQVLIPGGTVTTVGTAATTAANAALTEYSAPQVGPFACAAGDVIVCAATWSQDTRNAMVCPPSDDSQASEWMLVADSGPTALGQPRAAIWTRYCNAAVAALNVKFPNSLVGPADTLITVAQVTGATAWNCRFVGACSDIQTQSPNGMDIRTTVTCGGTLRAMGQGNPPAHSSIWRQAVATGALAYWPLEGGTLATVLPSPIPGVGPATAFGTYAPGNSVAAYPFSDALGTFTFGNVVGYVPAYSPAANVAGMIFGAVQLSATDAGAAAKAALLMARTSGAHGTAHSIFIQYTNDTTATLVIFDEAFNTLGTAALAVTNMLAPGAPVWFVSWIPNAANPTTKTDFQFGNIDAVTGAAAINAVTTVTTTVGAITDVWLGRDPTGTANFIKPWVGGHLGASQHCVLANAGALILSDMIPTSVSFTALDGWVGENRFERMMRICQEQSVPLAVPNGSNTVKIGTAPTAMGFQPSLPPLAQLLLCASTDTGELADARCGGLLYRSLANLSAQTAVCTLDYSAMVIAAPLTPVDDDSITRNDVTATQLGGTSARTVVLTGALGVATVGDYATQVTVDVAVQSRDLQHVAEWLAHVGTVNEQRFPAVTLPLEASSNVQAFSAIDIGQRITIANTPAWIQPGPSEEIVIGVAETLGPISEWTITLVCEPYSPYAVLRLDGGATFGQLDVNYLGLWGQS